MKNRPQTAEVGFLKTEPRKPSFRILNFEVGLVFRKPISEIFIGFCTPLLQFERQRNYVKFLYLTYELLQNV